MNEHSPSAVKERIPIIDVDFHPQTPVSDPDVMQHLPRQWAEYIATYGFGTGQAPFFASPSQREFTHRMDALDPRGRTAADPDFSRRQTLDLYDMTAVMLTYVYAIVSTWNTNRPLEMRRAVMRAVNDYQAETWLRADPRYRATIVVPRDIPDAAAEVKRIKHGPLGDRFVGVLSSPSGQEPLGHEVNWPVFQACVEHDLPYFVHVAAPMGTALGAQSYYSELHMNFAQHPMALIPSMIFSGVFNTFPTLQVGLLEFGWSWAPMLAWRMDRIYTKLKGEVPHLKKMPSDYLREHFWFATQPVEEPEDPREVQNLYKIFEETGLGDRLMYSSDYPHWDFDSPYDAVNAAHPIERRRRILGENASRLLKIPLKPRSGILAYERPVNIHRLPS